MFKQALVPESETVTLYFEDMPITAPKGVSVAAAVLGAGFADGRSTAIKREPRGPHCLMGVCFECLMEIDGEPNRQSCLIPVREGMRVRRQHGAPSFRQEETRR